jgi:hypothetical protein
MLIHVSEESDIELFEPRRSEYMDEPVVWAIDATRLCNYLVPRDCPRVTYYAGRTTSPNSGHCGTPLWPRLCRTP